MTGDRLSRWWEFHPIGEHGVSTSDTFLATACIARGARLIGTERHGEKVWFTFDPQEGPQDTLQALREGNCDVNAENYEQARLSVHAAIRAIMGWSSK